MQMSPTQVLQKHTLPLIWFSFFLSSQLSTTWGFYATFVHYDQAFYGDRICFTVLRALSMKKCHAANNYTDKDTDTF